MRAVRRKLFKLAKYSTNEQKEITLGSFHLLEQPPKEEIDFIIGDGPGKETRALKFQNVLNHYVFGQIMKNHELLEKNSLLKDEIIKTERRVVSAEQRVSSAKDEVVSAEQRVSSTIEKWKNETVEITEKWKETENELRFIKNI